MNQKLADLLNAIFGFRKFIALVVIYLTGIIFRIYGLIDGSQLVDLFKAITISFFTANGIEHAVNAVKDYTSAKYSGDDPKTAYEDLIAPSEYEPEDEDKENAK